MASANATRDHDEIQRWAQQHGAVPTVVSRTGGMLRFEFSPDADRLTPVEWDEFFRIFDSRGLELIFDPSPGSRFHKFIYPESESAHASGARSSSNAHGRSTPKTARARSRTGIRKAA